MNELCANLIKLNFALNPSSNEWKLTNNPLELDTGIHDCMSYVLCLCLLRERLYVLCMCDWVRARAVHI